jgi:hypothetical protein
MPPPPDYFSPNVDAETDLMSMFMERMRIIPHPTATVVDVKDTVMLKAGFICSQYGVKRLICSVLISYRFEKIWISKGRSSGNKYVLCQYW